MKRLISISVMLAVTVAASGCRHQFSPNIKAIVGDEGGAFGIMVRNYGPFQQVNSFSYLPGEPVDSSDLVASYEFHKDELLVSILTLENTEYSDQVFVEEYARIISDIPAAITRSTGIDIPVRQLKIALIPEGKGIEWTHGSFRREGLYAIGFALRSYAKSNLTLSDSVRTLAHELFHLGARRNYARTGFVNELAAVTLESCIELTLLGSTSGTTFGEAARGHDFRNMKPDVRNVVSIKARYGYDPQHDMLFKEGPIDVTQKERTDALLTLCRERVAEVMK